MIEAKRPDPGAEGPQNQSERFIIPMAKDPVRAAAEAVAKGALEATLQAATQFSRPLVQYDQSSCTLRINNNFSVRIDRHNQQIPFLWHKPSGTLGFGITTKRKLEDDAEAQLHHEKRSAAPAAMTSRTSTPRPQIARNSTASR